MTVAQVAAEAGVAVGTVYLYFRSKEQLHRAVMESKADRLLSRGGAREGEAVAGGAEDTIGPRAPGHAEIESMLLDMPRPLREREVEAKRRDILDSAVRVFAREGFHAATMAHIAAGAGMSSAGLYQHFGSKEDLYLRLLDEKIDELLALLGPALAVPSTALGKVRVLVSTELAFFASNRELFRIFFAMRSGFDPLSSGFGEAIERRQAAYLELVTAILRRGVEDGELRPAPEADLARVLIGMVNAMVNACILDSAGEPLTARADWLVAFFARAAAVDAGSEAS